MCVRVRVCKTKTWPFSLIHTSLIRSTKKNTQIHKFCPVSPWEPVFLSIASLLLLAPSQILLSGIPSSLPPLLCMDFNYVSLTTPFLWGSSSRKPPLSHKAAPICSALPLPLPQHPARWPEEGFYSKTCTEQAGQTQIVLELHLTSFFLRTLQMKSMVKTP